MNPNSPLDKVWQGIKNLKSRFLNDTLDSINEYHIENNVEVDVAFNKISKQFVYNDSIDIILNSNVSDENSVLNNNININEVKVAINNSKKKSSPGIDNIT